MCHSEGAIVATEESLIIVVEILRFAQNDTKGIHPCKIKSQLSQVRLVE